MFSEKQRDQLLLIGTIAGVIGAIAAVWELRKEQPFPNPQPFSIGYSCEKADWQPPCPSETGEKGKQSSWPVPRECKREQWGPPCK